MRGRKDNYADENECVCCLIFFVIKKVISKMSKAYKRSGLAYFAKIKVLNENGIVLYGVSCQ